MKAFLSHSSKDKGFVEGVASLLKPGTFELDSVTFDAGLISSESIQKSLERSDIFCLFLSKNSIASAYVQYETLLGTEFFASGRIKRFLSICIDSDAFDLASENVRYFNIVRKSVSAESAARLVMGTMIAAVGDQSIHPFIGREGLLVDLEKQVTDPSRPATKAVYVSGNLGSGRRSLTQKFYQNQYPRSHRIFPVIHIDEFSGLAEIHRKVLASTRPLMKSKELVARATAFAASDPNSQKRQIADLVNSLLSANEAMLVYDNGGLLTDVGEFEPEIASVIDLLESRPHPPLGDHS